MQAARSQTPEGHEWEDVGNPQPECDECDT
jgi:hypothetical protein